MLLLPVQVQFTNKVVNKNYIFLTTNLLLIRSPQCAYLVVILKAPGLDRPVIYSLLCGGKISQK